MNATTKPRLQKRTVFIFKRKFYAALDNTGDPTTSLTGTSTITDPTNTSTATSGLR